MIPIGPAWLDTCEHGRTGDTCEQCAFTEATARGALPARAPELRGVPDAARGQVPEVPEAERAEVDILIPRADLGVGCYTLIRSGDAIPRGLAGLPRVPVAAAAKVKGKRS